MKNKKAKKEKKMPEAKFRAGSVTATVWKNEGNEFTSYTTALERSYLDKNDEWQKTSSFNLNDIPKAVLVLNQAYKHINQVARQKENADESDEDEDEGEED